MPLLEAVNVFVTVMMSVVYSATSTRPKKHTTKSTAPKF